MQLAHLPRITKYIRETENVMSNTPSQQPPDATGRIQQPESLNWKDLYREKLVSSHDAAALVQSGDYIYLGGGTSIPPAFASELGKRSRELENVTVYQGFATDFHEYMKPEHNSSFNIETLFLGPMERFCVQCGMANYVPIHLSDIANVAKRMNFQKVAFMATPPDENGYMNRSLFGSFCPNEECIKTGDILIAEVNRNTPTINGEDLKIHVSQVDYIIENDSPIFVLPEAPTSEVEKNMASLISELIPDGATIQLGIGGLTNAIGHFLSGKKDLGMHSEVVTPSVMNLIESGVINGSRKNFMPGKIICAFAVGTREFYDYLDKNETFVFKEISWVNDPDIIAKNDNLVSVNSALMIDLTGQVAAESIGTRQYSGTGGQVDFVQGAKKSRGGKSIITLKSTFTDKDGTLQSKIVPSFPPGTVVTTSRNDVEYVITEYGVVNLRYKNIHERVKLLISIAHPDFRDELEFEAKKPGWI